MRCGSDLAGRRARDPSRPQGSLRRADRCPCEAHTTLASGAVDHCPGGANVSKIVSGPAAVLSTLSSSSGTSCLLHRIIRTRWLEPSPRKPCIR
jgi:hypothetical protein